MSFFGTIGRGFKRVGKALFGGGGGQDIDTDSPDELGYARDQQPRRGLLSKLLEFGTRTAGGIGAIAGNKAGQEAWENYDAQQRVERRDMLAQKKFEADELQREAENKSRELRDELTRFQMEEARRQSAMAPRSAEEALAREVARQKALEGAKPEEFDVETFVPEGQERPQIFERSKRTGLRRPAMADIPQPDIELPAPPQIESDDPMRAIPKTGPSALPRPPKRSALYRPDKLDTSITAYEDFRRKYPPTSEGQAQAAEEWQGILKPPKPSGGDEITGSGRPLFDKSTGRYLGDYFPKSQKFVPAPTDVPGVPGEGLTTRPLTETGERVRSDAGTALVLLDDIEGADWGEQALESVPFAIGARSLRAAKDDVMDILRRLRTGAAINAAEEGFYRDQIPGPLDTEEDRAYKSGILRQLFTALSTGQPKPNLAQFKKAGIGGKKRTGLPAPQAKISVTDPRGKVHTFNSQAEADEFKKLAGIK